MCEFPNPDPTKRAGEKGPCWQLVSKGSIIRSTKIPPLPNSAFFRKWQRGEEGENKQPSAERERESSLGRLSLLLLKTQ